MRSYPTNGSARAFLARSRKFCRIPEYFNHNSINQTMKTVILCGGRGTRLGEHGASIPKALIEIGGRPLLWHLMKIYAHHGLNDFILCLGYLGDAIKRYFLEHHWLYSDFTLEMGKAGDYQLSKSGSISEDWRVTFSDTGLDTNTGGRVKRVERYVGDDETFCVTYGDGLADI